MKTHLLVSVFFCSMLIGCSGAEENRPAPSAQEDDIELPTLDDSSKRTVDSRNSVAKGACSTGEAIECRIYLPTHNDIQPCFVGEQVCEESLWSECGNAVLVDANAEDTVLTAEDLDEEQP